MFAHVGWVALTGCAILRQIRATIENEVTWCATILF